MNRNDATTLASHLKDKRVQRGWSEAVLAQKAGLSEQAIREYEANPSALTEEISYRLHHALTRRRASRRPPSQTERLANLYQVESALNIDQKLFRDTLKIFEKAFLIPDLSPE